jgi:hypothetical protein
MGYCVTVSIVDAEIVPEVAVMVVLPGCTSVARPSSLIVATPVLVEVHVTPELMSRVLPSLKCPVAANC